LQAIGFDEKNASQLLRLKPLLAYAVGRDKKGGRSVTKIGKFYNELSFAIDTVMDATENVIAKKIKPQNPDELTETQLIAKYFNNFINLVEAIVAYHKFKGGSEA